MELACRHEHERPNVYRMLPLPVKEKTISTRNKVGLVAIMRLLPVGAFRRV